jgi:hypothetical protein
VLEPKVLPKGAGPGAPKGFDDVFNPADVGFEPKVFPNADDEGPVGCPKGEGVMVDPNGFELLLVDVAKGEELGAVVCWKGEEEPMDMAFEEDVALKGDGFDAVNGDGAAAKVLMFVPAVFANGDGCDVEVA